MTTDTEPVEVWDERQVTIPERTRQRLDPVPQRSVRIEQHVWDAALDKAERRRAAGHRGETVSAKIREALVAYANEPDEDTDDA